MLGASTCMRCRMPIEFIKIYDGTQIWVNMTAVYSLAICQGIKDQPHVPFGTEEYRNGLLEDLLEMEKDLLGG